MEKNGFDDYVDSMNKPGMADKVEYQAESIVSQTLLKDETGNVSLFAFDAEQGLSEHSAPFDAEVHILDGIAEIIIDGISHHIDAGKKIMMPANIPHALKANEQFKMLLVMKKTG